MANSPAEAFSDFNLPDPAAMQSEQNQYYNQQVEHAPSVGRGWQMRLDQPMPGMDPAIQKAQLVQSRMKDILQQANENAPANEDPLDKQARIAQLVTTDMANVDPNIAMQAAKQLVQIQQARGQQKYLSAETGRAEAQTEQARATTAAERIKADSEKMSARYIMAAPGTDKEGIPVLNAYGDPSGIAMYDDKGNLRDSFHSELVAAAAKAPPGATMMTIDQYNQLRAKAGEAAAYARIQAAVLRAAQANANADRFTMRVAVGADMASTAATNLTQLPLGASSGVLGLGFAAGGAHTGMSVLDATSDALKWKLSDGDTSQYNIYKNGLVRGLATLETSGGLQGMVGLSKQIDATMSVKTGDKIEDVMSRMAETRQLIHNGIDPYLASPKTPQGLKDLLNKHLQELDAAIPYTVPDVIKLRAGKNPRMTIGEAAAQRQKQGVSDAEAMKQNTAATTGGGNAAEFVGAPPAPAEDGHKLKDSSGKIVAISQGGKWVTP